MFLKFVFQKISSFEPSRTESKARILNFDYLVNITEELLLDCLLCLHLLQEPKNFLFGVIEILDFANDCLKRQDLLYHLLRPDKL